METAQTDQFDVFLCHNSKDKPAVKKIGLRLKKLGIRPWLDEWELRPGLRWLGTLSRQISKIRSAAVFIGSNGKGPWQSMEIEVFLNQLVKRGCPVIPVILPNAPKVPNLPLFLSGMTWVDFRKDDPDPMERLVWGITGKRGITDKDIEIIGPVPDTAGTLPEEITGRDGAQMRLIPAGEFQMDSDDYDDEKPVHTVYLDAFYIDKYEVTNAQYKEFMESTGHKAPLYWDDSNYNSPGQPVVGVTWEDANAYAKWAGKLLPTEAEWEKAARGGLVGKKYVWGDDWPPPEKAGNFADESAKKVFTGWSIIEGYDDGYAYAAPVGSFSPNGHGLYDMAGNVWEWCVDWYDGEYYKRSPERNPTGPDSGSTRVLRGGSWYYDGPDYLRVANRNNNDPTNTNNNVGFRCAMLLKIWRLSLYEGSYRVCVEKPR